MNIHEISRIFVGSVCVYVVVASCSPNEGNSSTTQNGSSGSSAIASNGGSAGIGNGSEGGRSNSSGSGSGSSILSTLLNPVPDAYASTGGSRLKAKYRSGSDGSKEYIPGQWWDSARNEDCAISGYPMSDGTLRCLPASNLTYAASYYGDSACSQPIFATTAAASGCPAATLQKYVQLWTQSCGSYSIRIFNLGGAHSGSAYTLTGTTCTAASTTTTATLTFYDLGSELPVSTFVSVSNGHD